MKKSIIAILLSTAPCFSLAANYATCLLDNLPGLQNDQAAAAAIQVCNSQHPGGMDKVAQGNGRGFLGFDSGAECALKKAGETRSSTAAYQIRLACDRLYDKPKPKESCEKENPGPWCSYR